MTATTPFPALSLRQFLTARSGFTLVEILVVIAIISLLAGVVLLNVAPQLGMGKQAAARAQIKVFASALDTYNMANGRYPTQAQGLDALVRKPTQPPIPDNYPDGGYLQGRTIPHDPWKNPYVYLIPGRRPGLFLGHSDSRGRRGGADFRRKENLQAQIFSRLHSGAHGNER